VKYGYSNVGEVVEGALRGRPVFCLYPHQTAYVVDRQAVVPLPNGIDPARAVLGANMETALNALWDAAPLLGDRVSVVGGGVVGCLVAYLAARIAGTEVELVDINPERARVANALGVAFVAPDRARPERDLVVHASGSPLGLRTALELAVTDGTVLELSWFGDAEVSLPLGRAFHARRLALRASQVGTLSPRARARHTRTSRLEAALRLCGDPTLDVLIDGESPFTALPEIMTQLTSAQSGALCHRVRYEAE
jgi:threonine dehydrogenase-like Zn-dependent dehydrogenase